jgi:nucleoside-diphosphate-sugar epimerase/predicted dehydrogenase
VVSQHLLPALRRINWYPAVLADPSTANLNIATQRLGAKGKSVAQVADFRSKMAEFDAAIVAAPHALHGPIGLELLRAGKHLFMEKPLATSSVACREMIAEAQQRQVTLSVGLLRRYLHVAHWTRALVTAGALGEIRKFEAREGFIFNWATSTDSLFRPESAGGGVLMDTGAHTIDLLLWLLGPVAHVDYKDDGRGGVEADCILNCVMESGAEGSVELSRSRNLRNSVRIDGTQGFVEIHLYQNQVLGGSPHILAFSHNGITAANMPAQRFPELFQAELNDFKLSASDGLQHGVPGADGAASVELIERCYAVRQPLEHSWARFSPAMGAGAQSAAGLARGSTVVITGGSGFIGGRLAEVLSDQGVHVRCVVRSMTNCGRLGRLPVKLVKADLADADAVREAISGADYVFHCAYDPRSIHQNLEGTRNLIDASEHHAVKRLVYLSTFSVYEPFPDGELHEEIRDGDRSWVYVRTKLDLEQAIFDRCRTAGLPATIVQPSIVYGPFSKPWTNAPAEMLLYGDLILPDKGSGICNAVYIDDLVEGLIATAVNPNAVGERFILSGPEPITWGAFFETFAAALDTNKPIYRPTAEISKANHGMMRDVRLVLKNPKRIMQIIVRWDPARRALQGGLDAMPGSLKALVDKYYFGTGERRPGEVALPDPQLLRLYTSKAFTSSEKAKRLLGYRPKYDFQDGMVQTAAYLDWAYGDVKRSLRQISEEPERSPVHYRPADTARAS